jgi:hypothetical protein
VSSDRNAPTPVPRHIDRNERLVEYVIVFYGCFFWFQYPIGPGYALLTGIAATVVYARITVGRPPGYLMQSLLYRKLGLAARGLIDRRTRGLRP